MPVPKSDRLLIIFNGAIYKLVKVPRTEANPTWQKISLLTKPIFKSIPLTNHETDWGFINERNIHKA